MNEMLAPGECPLMLWLADWPVHVRLIGYWCRAADRPPDEDDRMPDPRDLIDESWSNQEGELVASYFEDSDWWSKVTSA
jgi:hypothetical protein